MSLQKFSNGDRVRWTDGETERKGIVTESDVEEPADAGDRAGMRFYRVSAADGATYVVAEGDMAPTDSSSEEHG